MSDETTRDYRFLMYQDLDMSNNTIRRAPKIKNDGDIEITSSTSSKVKINTTSSSDGDVEIGNSSHDVTIVGKNGLSIKSSSSSTESEIDATKFVASSSVSSKDITVSNSISVKNDKTSTISLNKDGDISASNEISSKTSKVSDSITVGNGAKIRWDSTSSSLVFEKV